MKTKISDQSVAADAELSSILVWNIKKSSISTNCRSQFLSRRIPHIYEAENMFLKEDYIMVDNVKAVAPLGYAGNPAGYEIKRSVVENIFKILTDYCAKKS